MKKDRDLLEVTAEAVQLKTVIAVALGMALSMCITVFVDEFFKYGLVASVEIVASSISFPIILAFLIKLIGSVYEDIVN